ncbi:uncharacterized protein LOC101854738 [Aplysia californica]|uniref:Uncharacterized protein LOC101854738 n=1 Tax=Aplysia californica TaxID=6500 RepID=A0ABM1A6D9_APLCA|nr:uncharacterized protein LOC101854738 [Aplysia californica]
MSKTAVIGVSLALILVSIFLSCKGRDRPPIQCYQCQNYLNLTYYDFCPMNSTVDLERAFSGDCEGMCFTRTDKSDPKLVFRGCTTGQGNMPNPLPKTGCYDWNGAVICICDGTYCNLVPMGTSSGVSLNEHLTDPNITVVVDTDGPLQCYQCINYDTEGTYYAQCPLNTAVVTHLAYHDNCTDKCFTRTAKDNPLFVARGCTDSQYGMPDPMPADGCYTYRGETWCVCSKPYCNQAPIGISSGVRLDAHLAIVDPDFKEDDGVFKCYSCVAVDLEGNYYSQCPKNDRVQNAYLAPCNGSCITRSYDYDDRQVGRGCSDNVGTIPKPLPPDGCYKWYLDIWCVCSTSRCNGGALGEPKSGVEFDSHLKENDPDSSPRAESYALLVFGLITAAFLFKS